jgi:curved DNA-binding protein CbpA
VSTVHDWSGQPREQDLYTVLGVDASAAPDRITAAYRRLMRELHPDTRREEDPAAAERCTAVIAAYRTLRDHDRRAAYDAQRSRADAVPPRRGALVPVAVRRRDLLRWPRPGVSLRIGPVRVTPLR